MKKSKTGLVIKIAGNVFTVKDFLTKEILDCRIRGKLRLKDVRTTNPVTIGDTVFFESDESPIITEVVPRQNYIIRKSTN
ncbi:MAG: ribosome small subunit-dependent GTPase A, partial [Bacteroidales bacterium]